MASPYAPRMITRKGRGNAFDFKSFLRNWSGFITYNEIMNEYSTKELLNFFWLNVLSICLWKYICLINFLHENCTDDGERCDSFTHMYQNPNVL